MITYRAQLALVAALLLYLFVARRERARRIEEEIPRGVAGFKADFKANLADRLFLLGLFASWIFFTFGPPFVEWFMSHPTDWFLWHKIWIWWFGGVFVTSLWFLWRRRELERLHTLQAAAVALGVVVVSILISAYDSVPPGFATTMHPDPLSFLRIGVIAFFGTYFILRRANG